MMTTTTHKSSRRNLLRKPVRGRGYPGSRDRETRSRSIARDLDGAILEEPEAASSRAAFVSGVKATAPVLLALIPFAVAVIVLTVLFVNLRMTLYSASLAPHFRPLPARWKGLLSYLLTDQAYAAAITRFDEGRTEEADKRWYYLGAALAVWGTWQPAAMLGVFLGSRASEGWALDFVLPLTFIALVLPAIKDRMTATAALSAGGTAIFVATMPLNLGLITAALVGVLGGLAAEILSERGGR